MLHEQIINLELLLKEKSHNKYQNYNQIQGITDKELNNIENSLSIKLPEDFKAFYQYKNGTKGLDILNPTWNDGTIQSYSLLSLEEIVNLKEKDFNEEELMIDYLNEEEISKLDNRIKPYFKNKNWIPFGVSNDNVFLFLDYDPTDKGKEAQIITYIKKTDFVYYVAENFTEMLKDSLNNSKNYNFF